MTNQDFVDMFQTHPAAAIFLFAVGAAVGVLVVIVSILSRKKD